MNAKHILSAIKSRALKALASASEVVDLRDAHVYGGTAAIFYGLNLAYPPAAYVVAGLILFWLGVRK